jgi:RNA polymerase sigma factor (sigma-70 family)
MSATGTAVAGGTASTDAELIAGVRSGDDLAFEELYRRYQRRISAFVRRVVRDEARAEDVTQEAFVSALRRLRATDSEIAFKPWIYEIARNAAIDHWRRSSRAEEVSINQDDLLRPDDRARLVGAVAPEASLIQKERIDHLAGALDELSQTHHRILVMRELEGLSYREIGEQLELSRPAVESTLFRARRRLESEYEELQAGRRCDSIAQAIVRIADGLDSESDRRRLSRHALRCSFCRRRARQQGVEPLRVRRAAARAAAILPLPGFLRRRMAGPSAATAQGDAGTLGQLAVPAAHAGAAVAERAVALVATIALVGAGSAVIGGATGHRDGWLSGGHDRGAVAPKGSAGTQHGREASGPRSAGSMSLRRHDSPAAGDRGSAAHGDSPKPSVSGQAGRRATPETSRRAPVPTSAVPALPGLAVAPPEAPGTPDAPTSPDRGRPDLNPPPVALSVPSSPPPAPEPEYSAPLTLPDLGGVHP